jgi:long-chain fatty acid transport protein
MRSQLLAAAAILVPAAAFAGGYIVPNTAPRDLGMADSAMAAQTNASAVFKNPSALAGIQGLNIELSGSVIDFRSTWSDPTGTTGSGPVTMTPKAAFPPTVFASYGGRTRGIGWGVGAGWSIPGGGEVFWPGTWAGRQAVTTVDRRINGFYLTGGVQPIPQLKVGGGLIYYRGTEHLTQALNFLGNEGGAELGTAGGGFSYDVSAELTPIATLPLTIGIDYKHQSLITMTGHAHFDGVPPALKPAALDQGVTHKLNFPNQLNAGIAYRPIAPLLVTGGFTWERYVVYRSDVFAGDLGTTVVVPREYRHGSTFRLGAELAALPILRVRAGVLRDNSPTNTDFLHPSIPDSSSTALTFGASVDVSPRIELSAAYFHDWQDRTTTTSGETFPGTYDTRANIYSIGMVYRMK